MATVRHLIVASKITTGERVECFSWTRNAQDGIDRAKYEAKLDGTAKTLTNFRAEPIGKPTSRYR